MDSSLKETVKGHQCRQVLLYLPILRNDLFLLRMYKTSVVWTHQKVDLTAAILQPGVTAQRVRYEQREGNFKARSWDLLPTAACEDFTHCPVPWLASGSVATV